MAKDVIHISEAEAASDFALVMTRVREGTEVIIKRDAKPVAIVRPAEPLRGRPISESIALAEVHAKEVAGRIEGEYSFCRFCRLVESISYGGSIRLQIPIPAP
jgi:antitoxin (DNA-binding transcriptional repressor) of toxin-antitoxin stability system